MAIDKPKLDNARKLRGIYFLDLDDGEFKETIQKARKNMKVPTEAAVPSKMETRTRLKKSRGKSTTKPKEPTKSKRQSMHASWRHMNIAGKEFYSIGHHNLVRNFVHMPQAMKILDAHSGRASCSGQRMGEARMVASVTIQSVTIRVKSNSKDFGWFWN